MAKSTGTRIKSAPGLQRAGDQGEQVVLPEPFGPVTAMRSGPLIVGDWSRSTDVPGL